MVARRFNLNPKMGNDLLLAASGEKTGGYTMANYVWDLMQSQNITPSLPAVEAYYRGLKKPYVTNPNPSVSPIRMEQFEQEADKAVLQEEENPKSNDERREIRKKKRKKQQLLEETAKAAKRGVCYLSRIPPHMDPLKLRQILSHYGEILRIYLTPEGFPMPHSSIFLGLFYLFILRLKYIVNEQAGFAEKNSLKGGKKRSIFFYDLWNIKYLSKFKWEDLTEEIAYKNASREQKLALEISAAKKERDFYLSKVEKSRALTAIEERMKKKQKVQQESGATAEPSQDKQVAKVIRQFPQTRSVDTVAQNKPRLSQHILAGVSCLFTNKLLLTIIFFILNVPFPSFAQALSYSTCRYLVVVLEVQYILRFFSDKLDHPRSSTFTCEEVSPFRWRATARVPRPCPNALERLISLIPPLFGPRVWIGTIFLHLIIDW
ncbi:hypothetical protein RHMOL_Rhmol10G0020400 [Rhododendron molle]|uniref:Uncharacterized protein n=2 Tax=Rhododendron molle TaxID=49168 RepID=A0ACC0LY41_RHOML|nr:hypothetical protein RHMOL_Rhmol10G0020400 [Rhododendron molle]